MRIFDRNNSQLDGSELAEAYRATIPLMADARHVTLRMCGNRMAEVVAISKDFSDSVEVGYDDDKKLRIIAAPQVVHPDAGAEMVEDQMVDPHEIHFCVNGIPEVKIIRIRLSRQEQAAVDKAEQDAKAAAAKAEEERIKLEEADAFEQGKREARIEAAKEAGRQAAGEKSK